MNQVQNLYQSLEKRVFEAYSARRPKSAALHQAAQQFLPGGDTRTVAFFRPFPVFIDRGEGCHVTDVDGNRYTDFGNNQTSLIHGHAHPKIVQAVVDQVKRGTAFAACVENQFKLGQIICERLPSAERVRFCNSGTEATIGAIRLARAYRKKYKIVKMEGGYHGSHDLVEISVKPTAEEWGPIENPRAIPEDPSIPPKVVSDCIIIPFNRSEIAERIISQNQEDLAAVIVEPVLGAGGMLPASTEFLRMLRDITLKFQIPLIFDEVYTFRLSPGGYQEISGVIPDITALAKIIGGGFPVGGIAGKEKFMNLFSPMQPKFLVHSGTFNGNPVTMAAGKASMTELTPAAIERINGLGAKLRESFKKALQETGVVAQVTGIGSLSQIHFTASEVKDWRTASTARVDVRTLLFVMLLERGIFPAARGMFNISTPMGEKEVDEAGTALKSCLQELKPYLEKASPELIA